MLACRFQLNKNKLFENPMILSHILLSEIKTKYLEATSYNLKIKNKEHTTVSTTLLISLHQNSPIIYRAHHSSHWAPPWPFPIFPFSAPLWPFRFSLGLHIPSRVVTTSHLAVHFLSIGDHVLLRAVLVPSEAVRSPSRAVPALSLFVHALQLCKFKGIYLLSSFIKCVTYSIFHSLTEALEHIGLHLSQFVLFELGSDACFLEH